MVGDTKTEWRDEALWSGRGLHVVVESGISADPMAVPHTLSGQ